MSNPKPQLMKRLADLVCMRKILHPKHLVIEGELASTRWFAYSFMSPVEATEEFRRVYTDALRRYVRSNVDRELAERVSGVRPGVPAFRTQQYTQLWRARQKADRLGMPYQLLIDFGFDFAQRRTRKASPLPHQIFATVKSEHAWQSMFQVELDEKIYHAMHRLEVPQFRLEHDRGLPIQSRFRDQTKSDQVASLRDRVDLVGWIAITNRYLSLDECLSAYSADQASRVLERLSAAVDDGLFLKEPHVMLDDDDFLVGCFGISEAIDAPGSSCSRCPLRDRCRNVAAAAERVTLKLTGHVSPVAEADRKRNQAKVAAHRAREKATASAPLTAL